LRKCAAVNFASAGTIRFFAGHVPGAGADVAGARLTIIFGSGDETVHRCGDGNRHRAALGGDQVYRYRLARRHQPVARDRVEAHVGGQHQRVFELILFLREPQIDFITGVFTQRSERSTQIADGLQSARDRGRRRAVAVVGKCLPRFNNGGRDGIEARRKIGRRIDPRKTRQAAQAGIDPVEDFLLRARNATFEHRIAQSICAHAARTHRPGVADRQWQQLRHALALVHAACFAANLVVGPAQHRIEHIAAGEIQIRRRFDHPLPRRSRL
jgi:hypothetical protein